MQVKKWLAAGMLLCCLSSCNFTVDSVDSLMKPPNFSKQQQEIYSALRNDSNVGKNITLVYPKTGDYLSAYVIKDFDGEPTEEALVFYKENDLATGSSVMKINILDQENPGEKDSRWLSCWTSSEINATGVEKLSFIEIPIQGEEKKVYIVIGFNLVNADANSNTKELKVFEYVNGQLSDPLFTENCIGYEVYDINQDGVEEIVPIVSNIAEEVTKISAKMYVYHEGQFSADGVACTMDNSATEYSGIYRGVLEDGTPAIYFDGLRGNSLATEIVVASNGYLENLTLFGEHPILPNTYRSSGLSCMDINNDGVYEIPREIDSFTLPGMTTWYRFDEEGLHRLEDTYTDYFLGYQFYIPHNWPDDWYSEIGVKKDSINNEVLFYRINPEDNKDDSKKLLKIKTFTLADWNFGKSSQDFQFISDNGQLAYAYQLYPENMRKTPYEITEKQVLEGFRYLSDHFNLE